MNIDVNIKGMPGEGETTLGHEILDLVCSFHGQGFVRLQDEYTTLTINEGGNKYVYKITQSGKLLKD